MPRPIPSSLGSGASAGAQDQSVDNGGFVDVYAKSTGQKQSVPAHWLDHPVLGRDFELTPSARAASTSQGTETPRESSPEGGPAVGDPAGSDPGPAASGSGDQTDPATNPTR